MIILLILSIVVNFVTISAVVILRNEIARQRKEINTLWNAHNTNETNISKLTVWHVSSIQKLESIAESFETNLEKLAEDLKEK